MQFFKSILTLFLQFEVNDRNVELIEDALGGINIANCNEMCAPDKLSEKNLSTKNETLNLINEAIRNVISNEIRNETPKSVKKKQKKYAFDVVDDSSDQHIDPIHIIEKDDNANSSADELNHKRIVRVSLQKGSRQNQGYCFRGNDSFVLYDIRKIIDADKKYENVNIRFKTLSTRGLMFLIVEKPGNYFSLSIEDG